MPRTIQGAFDWFRAGPARDLWVDGKRIKDWNGGCEAAVNNACGFRSFETAFLAAGASGLLNRNTAMAQPGDLSYWGGVWDAKKQRYSGHVALHAEDPAWVYMASALAARLGVNFGWSLALVPLATYQAATGLPYLGNSRFHGAQQLDRTGWQSGTVTPITETIEEEPDMKPIVRIAPNGAAFLVGDDYAVPLAAAEVDAAIRVYGSVRHSQEGFDMFLHTTAQVRAQRADSLAAAVAARA